MSRLGVVGWPVAHSRSPAMQNAALSASGLGEGWHYQLLPVPPDLFDETVKALPGAGFRGINVTIPHKSAALALATDASERAQAIGAANTLLFEAGGRIYAENTDAPALIAALDAQLTDSATPRPLDGMTVLVLGAGGTARAAVQALSEAKAEVLVWNRTSRRAESLCEELGGRAVSTTTGLDPTVIVNCTSVGLVGQGSDATGPTAAVPLSEDQIAQAELIVDFVYRDGGTPLLNHAKQLGVKTVDGLELLVRQGALAFTLFTGLDAPVDAMKAAVGLSSSTYE